MVRSLLAVFAGYFLILIWVMTTHSFAWWLGGPGLAFRDGTMIETVPWLLISLVLWTIGGLMGGFVAALVGRHPSNLPSWVLAALVFAMSLYSAFGYLSTGAPEMPEGIDPTSIDAAQFGIKPEWFPFAMAALVAGGVVAGGWFAGDQSELRTPTEDLPKSE